MSKLRIAIFTALVAILKTSAADNVAVNQSAAPATGAEKIIAEMKHPVSWLNWGADFRVRNEYYDNLLTLNHDNALHEQDYFRFRARLWLELKPIDDVSFNARLATEPREWMQPAGCTPYKGRSGLDMTEGVVDSLNVQWKSIFGLPASVVVGRQDILLDEGWLTGDGTPFDGSWTYFLDAARFTYDLKEQHTLIQVIGILQDAKDDAWMPTINNQDRFLAEQNEKGAILHVANTSLRAANVTGYFIYKRDDRTDAFGHGNPAPRGGDNADIYTLGARLSGLLGEHWKYSAEGAYQFGEKQDRDIRDASVIANPATTNAFRDISAFGMNSKLSYLFKDKLNNQLGFVYEFLSGDNPRTSGDEMFDVLWGRWPRWSEIGLYSYAAETRIGQEANLHRFGPQWSFTPAKNLDFSATYCALFAEQSVPTRAADQALPLSDSRRMFSNAGNFRGHFAQAILKYKFNAHMAGHLWGECLFPGDYYARREVITFLRAEVAFTF